jgi:HPt (histidine-containing phosphotransfer) domain-containing protein
MPNSTSNSIKEVLPMNMSHESLQPIRSLFANDDVISEILPDFVRNLSGYVDKMRAAIERGDKVQAARVCHDLKGTAGGYGYPQISASAQLLEETLKTEAETTHQMLLVDQIATLCQQALVGLDQ